MSRRIAIYGGTFDPIHYGHLRSIEELRVRLKIDEIKLVPSSIPPHRDNPGASAKQRLKMLSLALKEFSQLSVDDREIQRSGVSYSVDTVKELREEMDDSCELLFVMGADAFALIHEWHAWQELTNYCHIIVMDRPGMDRPGMDRPGMDIPGSESIRINPLVLEWLEDKLVLEPKELEMKGFGRVLRVRLKQWDLSATDVRQRARRQEVLDKLVPETVAAYIKEQRLYQ